MSPTTMTYGPGDWFVLPLPDGRVVPGRIVLRVRGHVTLSYFFPPAAQPLELADVRHLHAGDAVLAVEVSGLRLADGSWPLLGGADDFNPDDWPVPEFELVVPHGPGEEALRIDILDRELLPVRSEYRPLSEAGQRPPGGTKGADFLEQWLVLRLESGTLRPLSTRPWWAGAAAGGQTGHAQQQPAPSSPSENQLVRLVLPGQLSPDHVDNVECLLLLELDPADGQVDGHLLGPDGAEILTYTNDAEALARRLVTLLEQEALPRGSHLLVRPGGPGHEEHRLKLH